MPTAWYFCDQKYPKVRGDFDFPPYPLETTAARAKKYGTVWYLSLIHIYSCGGQKSSQNKGYIRLQNDPHLMFAIVFRRDMQLLLKHIG